MPNEFGLPKPLRDYETSEELYKVLEADPNLPGQTFADIMRAYDDLAGAKKLFIRIEEYLAKAKRATKTDIYRHLRLDEYHKGAVAETYDLLEKRGVVVFVPEIHGRRGRPKTQVIYIAPADREPFTKVTEPVEDPLETALAQKASTEVATATAGCLNEPIEQELNF